MVLCCTFCSYRCSTRLQLLAHSFATHSVEPTFHLVCGIQGCLHSFKCGSTYSSFKSHACRKHPNWKEHVNVADTLPPMPLRPVENEAQDLTETSDVSEAVAVCATPSSAAPAEQTISTSASTSSIAQRTAAMFLLTFQERFRVSQTAINFAVGSINTIVDGVCEVIQHSLEAANSSIDTSAFDEREDPFSLLKTEYKQCKFYREVFGLIVSCSYHGCGMYEERVIPCTCICVCLYTACMCILH